MGNDRGLLAANWLALLIPAGLLGGAYAFQYVVGLFPCEMCWWQRYPLAGAVPLALLGLALGRLRILLVTLAALAILTSGLIGGFHAGVEYDWWEGITGCAIPRPEGMSPLEAIEAAPIVRCDVAPWAWQGISLAGWNFLISTAGALAILALLLRRKPA